MAKHGGHVDSCALILALMVASPSAAVADAVMGPPSSCPPGSAPIFGHGGSYCAPQSCDEAECPPNRVCQDVGLCVATLHVEGGSSYERFDEDIEVAIGACDDVSDCERSARDAYTATHTTVTREDAPRCERVRGCVMVATTPSPAPPTPRSNETPSDPAPLPPSASPRPTGGCGGCSARSIGSTSLGALAVLTLVWCLRQRARR